MDENRRIVPPQAGSPRTAEIVGYGLLATAVAAGVLYLDGQPPRDIAVVAGAILALLATLVLIAPRFRAPERDDVPRARHDEQARTRGSEPRVMPAPTPEPGQPEPGQPEPGTPARSATPGRRAKRGRRRR